MARRSVAHLHTHTSFSSLDGIAKLDELCAAAADDGQTALAITDHHSLGGTWKFNKAAHAAGLKPIIGMEAYLAIGDRFEKNSEIVTEDADIEPDPDTDADDADTGKTRKVKERRYEHLTVLAESPAGWSSLVAASNASHDPRSTWYKPRLDKALLAENAEGLIILTGCLGGPVARHLSVGNYELARQNLAQLVDNHNTHGETGQNSNVFVEVMDHGIPAELRIIGDLVKLAGEFNLPVVATNDAHYTHPDEADAHDHWLCVGQKGKTMSTPGRWRFQGTGYHLRTAAEMRALFDDQNGTESAIDNTLLIADRVHDNILPEVRLRLPKFACPDGMTSTQYLHKLVLEGAKRRYGSPLPAQVKTRLRYESDIVASAGLDDYFLITWDVLNAVRAAGHRVGYGRGSAGGSVLSYCLNIVGLDPLRYNLLFERFLNPDRTGMPDIDNDFDTAGRDFAIRYTVDKYGQNMVARIGTYGMAKSKRAIQDIARVTQVYATGTKLSKQVPSVAGKPLSLTKLMDPANPLGASFRDVLVTDPFAQPVVDTALTIEGVVSTEGIHACGVLISDQPMDAFVPLRMEYKKQGTKRIPTGIFVTQWDGKDVDAAGLLKIDYLGLRNLDIISKAVELIEATTGEVIDTDHLPDPDDLSHPRVRAAWDLISAGKTAGLFQLESAGITKLCEQIAPSCMDDIAAIVALYRPGPLGMGMHEHYAARKAGLEPVDYGIFTADPAEQAVIASVLDTTFGTCTYQEQLMLLSEVVAGFNPGQRNRLQKAFSKKIKLEMDAVGELFAAGALQEIRDADGTLVKMAFAASTVATLWKTFDASADYLFNASHSYDYGYVSFVTAFLKASWPAEYGAALLAVTEDDDKRLTVLNFLQAEGIPVAAPDVNLGDTKTSVDVHGNIRLGMAEIKGVGKHAAFVVAERLARGPYTSLGDLLARVKVRAEDGKESNISVALVSGLIEAGGCDSFGPRMGLAIALLASRDRPDLVVPDVEWGVVERSQRQRQRLGVITSTDHPLSALGTQLKTWTEPGRGTKPMPLHRITAADGQFVTTIGVIAGFAAKPYNGGQMANLTLEGSQGSINCVVWNETMNTMTALDELPAIGEIVGVTGRIKVRTFTLTVSDPGASSDDDDSEEGAEDAALVITEQVQRRELTVNKLWRGPLTDNPREFPRAAVYPLRRAPTPTPPRAARAKSTPRTGASAADTEQASDGTHPDLNELLTPVPAAATPRPVSIPTVLAAPAIAPAPPPIRRADAGPATLLHLLHLRAQWPLDGQLIDQRMGPSGQLAALKLVLPALASAEGELALRDWLARAEPGQRSVEFACCDGSIAQFEATASTVIVRRLRAFLTDKLATIQAVAS